MNHKLHIVFLLLVSAVVFNSCGTSGNSKKKMANEIAQNACESVSKFSGAVLGGAVSGILSGATRSYTNTGSIGGLPTYWCECYTYYTAKELNENFSLEELKEIRRDNLKKTITLTKLFELHQTEITECITATTNMKIKNYADFERKLNRKLKDR